MRSKAVLALVALGALAGCVGAPGRDFGQEARDLAFRQMETHAEATTAALELQPSDRVIEATEKAVAEDLKDPDSAKFRDVRLAEHPKGKIVCGEINGKNSYGAYVGYRLFYGSPRGGFVQRTGNQYPVIDANSNSALTAYCARR